jgi:hypothetical protein
MGVADRDGRDEYLLGDGDHDDATVAQMSMASIAGTMAVALGLVAMATRMTTNTATRMAVDMVARMVATMARMALPRELAARGDEFLWRAALGAERVVRWDCLVVEDDG